MAFYFKKLHIILPDDKNFTRGKASYKGFLMKEGDWYGYDEDTGILAVTTGKSSFGNIKVYTNKEANLWSFDLYPLEDDEGNSMFKIDDEQLEAIENSLALENKMPFDEWKEEKSRKYDLENPYSLVTIADYEIYIYGHRRVIPLFIIYLLERKWKEEGSHTELLENIKNVRDYNIRMNAQKYW